MKYARHLQTRLKKHFSTYKQALILLGARQIGKTTLLKHVFPQADYLLVDNERTRTVLESYDIHTYKQVLGQAKELIIDEAHLLSNPGRAAKIIYDQIPNIKLIITGSSALRIKNKSSESLAGRKIDYLLYPLTFSEYLVQKEIESSLNKRIFDQIIVPTRKQYLFSPRELLDYVLIFGQYPEVLNLTQPAEYLLNLADSVIYKDILELNLIDNRAKAKELLKLLAFQIGNLVNYSDLANRLKIDRRTVTRYIEIFEQSFILYRLYPFALKGRDEIGKMPKIYFYDLGLRNALIEDFSSLESRTDTGALFENFIINEVTKINQYYQLGYKLNFWRLKNGTEVDFVFSKKDEIIAAEIKLNSRSINHLFKKRYPQAKMRLVTLENFY